MRKATYGLILVLTVLVCAARNVVAEELKSAEELASYLSERIGKTFEIPETPPCDVITAEQRDHKIVVFKAGSDWNDPNSVVWEWDPKKEFPEIASWFSHVDECKPSYDLSEIMVNASGGGVARIRVADKKILFYARPGGNPHSIAKLPDGNVVSASSNGNFLAIFAVPEENETGGAKEPTPIFKKYEYTDAHGVVWDAKRSVLWAIGGKYVACYKYVGTKEAPELEEIYREDLQGLAFGGHDMYPAPGYDALITTGRGVNVFDPETRKFYPVADMKKVKSFSLSPDGVPLMQRAVEEWWSDTIIYGDEAATPVGTLAGAKFYKARWFVPNDWSR